MRASRILFLLAAGLLCHASGAPRPAGPAPRSGRGVRRQHAVGEQTQRAGGAQELLALSEEQNHFDHALAARTAEQALTLSQESGDSAGSARAYAQIAQCLFAQNDLEGAARNYERALQLWRDLNDPQEQAEILIMLGYVEDRKGKWSSAISFLTQAQSLLAGSGDPVRMGQIANGLADVFNQNGLPEKALVQYQRALDYNRQTPQTDDDALTTWAIGDTYYLLKNYPEALSNLRRALASFPPGSLHAALCHQYLGRVYGSMGEPGLAFGHLESALAVYARSHNPRELAQVLALMGQTYEQRGLLERARPYYRRALKTLIGLSDQVDEAAVDFALGRLELKAGRYDEAENYLRQSVEVTEDIRGVSASSDLTAAFSATVYERYEKYIECLMRQHAARPSAGLDARAFVISETARARSLAELLRATQTDLLPGLDPQLAAREQSLRQSLQLKSDGKVSLLGTAYRREELDALEKELSELKSQYRQVVATIRERYPSYRQISQPAAWDWRKIQEQVVADDETALLEYSLGSDRSYVWAVTRDGIRSYELPAESQIAEAAGRVYKSLATRPGEGGGEGFDAAGRDLSRMILSPVAAQLDKRRLIVVADGVLNYIPFQALPSPPDGNDPLIAEHEVVNAPSASLLAELRQEASRRPPAPKVLAAFGNPVFASDYALRKEGGGGGLSLAVQALGAERLHYALRDIELNGDSFDPSVVKPLFYAKRELDNLLAMTGGGDAFVAEGFAATREGLLSADLTRYSILHFATHGFLDPKRPENSGLLLSTVDREGRSQNGFVPLSDIYRLRAPVDLVVLSACQTGLGKDVRGEGLLGITRGFMYAGASGVVASLWKVDDKATAELMRLFYGNLLRAGMPPAEALRAAQNSLRQKPEWRAPYYWAAFTLQGEYGRAVKPAASGTAWRSLAAGGGALLVSLGGGVWWGRRRRRRRARG